MVLTLKIKQSFYQQKWIYWGITENCSWRRASYGKNVSFACYCKSSNKGEEWYFMEKQEEDGQVVLNESPLEETTSSR